MKFLIQQTVSCIEFEAKDYEEAKEILWDLAEVGEVEA